MYLQDKRLKTDSWFRNEGAKQISEPRKMTDKEMKDLEEKLEKKRQYMKKPDSFNFKF